MEALQSFKPTKAYIGIEDKLQTREHIQFLEPPTQIIIIMVGLVVTRVEAHHNKLSLSTTRTTGASKTRVSGNVYSRRQASAGNKLSQSLVAAEI